MAALPKQLMQYFCEILDLKLKACTELYITEKHSAK